MTLYICRVAFHHVSISIRRVKILVNILFVYIESVCEMRKKKRVKILFLPEDFLVFVVYAKIGNIRFKFLK